MAGHALSERHPGAVLALLPLIVRIVARRRHGAAAPRTNRLGRAGAGAVAGAGAAVAASVDKGQACKTTAVDGGTREEKRRLGIKELCWQKDREDKAATKMVECNKKREKAFVEKV